MHHPISLRAALCAAVLLSPFAVLAPSATAAQQQTGAAAMQTSLDGLANRAKPAQIGISVLDLGSGRHWDVKAETPFLMMSVFKAPVAATVLARVDAGTLALDQVVNLTRADIVPGSAVPSIGDQVDSGRHRFTLRELLVGAVSQSDNTAVDALLRVLGGAKAVSARLKAAGIDGMHIETGERELARISAHLKPGEAAPPHETPAQTLQREKRGYADVLADPRNQSTPAAAITFLRKLVAGELLSPASTAMLIDMMRKQTLPFRLRGGVPASADFADKTGTGTTVDGRTAAWNDIAIVTLADGRRALIAVFLKDSPMPQAQRDALFADIGKAVVAGLPARP